MKETSPLGGGIVALMEENSPLSKAGAPNTAYSAARYRSCCRGLLPREPFMPRGAVSNRHSTHAPTCQWWAGGKEAQQTSGERETAFARGAQLPLAVALESVLRHVCLNYDHIACAFGLLRRRGARGFQFLRAVEANRRLQLPRRESLFLTA